MKRIFSFTAIIALLMMFTGRAGFGQINPVVPNQGLTDVSEATYKSLTTLGRKDLGPSDSQLRILPGISRLRWIAENNVVLHPKVQLIGAYRWAWLELAGSNAVLDSKSSLRAATDQIRFELAKKMLKQSGAVLHMQPVRTATISQAQTSVAKPGEPNDPFFSRQREAIDLVNVSPLWGLDITVPKAISISKVAIAMMGTGLRCSHPDLSGVVDAANSRSFVDNAPCDPVASHETEVAGVAAAITNNNIGIAGVSQGVPILDWKIFRRGTDAQGKPVLYTNDEIILRAFVSVLALPYDLVIVNASFQETDPYDPGKFWARTLWILGDKALVVGGSGNESLSTSIRDTYPGTLSSLENVICLMPIDSQGRPAGFAGTGNKVELAAPGVNVFTTSDSTEGYATVSGVSFSIPYVSGTAAMLAKHAPKLPTPSELKQALLKGASLNLNLIGLMQQPRQLNGWRSWLALTGQLGSEPELATRFDRYDDGNGNNVFFPAPYSWVVIWGKQLADGYYDAITLPLPTTLGKVRVLLDGKFPLPLISVSPDRIDAQMPGDFVMAPLPGVKHSLTLVRVDRDGNPIVGSQITMPKFEANTTRPAIRALINENGFLVWDQNPAVVGETLRLFVSGLGRTTPIVQPGMPFVGTEKPEATVKLFINDSEVAVEVKALPTVGIFEAKFQLLLPSTMYNAKATLCAGANCAELWFNHAGGGL